MNRYRSRWSSTRRIPYACSVLAKPASSTGPGNCGLVRNRVLIRASTRTSCGDSGRSAGAIAASTPPGRSTRAISAITAIQRVITTRPMRTGHGVDRPVPERQPQPVTANPRPGAAFGGQPAARRPRGRARPPCGPAAASSRDIGPDPQARSSTVCGTAADGPGQPPVRRVVGRPRPTATAPPRRCPARSRWKSARYWRQTLDLIAHRRPAPLDSDPADEQVGGRLAVDLATGRVDG